MFHKLQDKIMTLLVRSRWTSERQQGGKASGVKRLPSPHWNQAIPDCRLGCGNYACLPKTKLETNVQKWHSFPVGSVWNWVQAGLPPLPKGSGPRMHLGAHWERPSLSDSLSLVTHQFYAWSDALWWVGN